jgi:hypothetical protein
MHAGKPDAAAQAIEQALCETDARLYTQRHKWVRMPVSRSAILGRPGRAGMPDLLGSLL